jgi:hypothetical protein
MIRPMPNDFDQLHPGGQKTITETAWTTAPAQRFRYPVGVSWWRLRPPSGSDRSVVVRRAIELQPALGLARHQNAPRTSRALV